MNKGDNMGELHYKNLSLDDIVYVDDNGVQCTEVWRDVPEYEGLYQVSDLGRVKSLDRLRLNKNGLSKIKGLVLRQNLGNHDYLTVGLSKESKRTTQTVHQLCCITFLNHKPCRYELVVDHKNNIKTDNKLINLQLLSSRENTNKITWIHKKTNFIGVQKMNNNKFISKIYYKGKAISLGSFNTEEEAYEYYKNAVLAIKKGNEIVVKRRVCTSNREGVYFLKRNNKWASCLKRKYIGVFKTEQEAYEARENYIKNLNL